MGGVDQGERYKPPFPMNLMRNQTVFWVVGGIVMIGGVIVAAIFQSTNASRNPDATPTPNASATAAAAGTTDPNATPSATVVAKQFTQADQVIDAATKNYTATIHTDKG